MALHYAATSTRALCGQPMGDRVAFAPLWSDFLAQVKADESVCCRACLNQCKRWQRFSRDLAIVRQDRKRSDPGDG